MPFVNNHTGKVATSELIVTPGADFGDPDGIGVLVYPDGTVTNRWGDGTVGVSEEARAASEDETEAMDPYTGELYVWKSKLPKQTRTTIKPKKRSKKSDSSLGGIML